MRVDVIFMHCVKERDGQAREFSHGLDFSSRMEICQLENQWLQSEFSLHISFCWIHILLSFLVRISGTDLQRNSASNSTQFWLFSPM